MHNSLWTIARPCYIGKENKMIIELAALFERPMWTDELDSCSSTKRMEKYIAIVSAA